MVFHEMRLTTKIVKSIVLPTLCVWCQAVFPQDNENTRQIVWTDPIPVMEPGSGKPLEYSLFFNGAIFEQATPFLPSWYELVRYEGAVMADPVEIADMHFVPLTPGEKGMIKKQSLPGASLRVKATPVIIRKEQYLAISFIPLRMNPLTSQPEKLIQFSLRIREPGAEKKGTQVKSFSYKPHSVLRTGKWYRVKVTADGVYKLTYSQIANLGITNPSQIRLFGKGGMMLSFQNADPKPDDLEENAIWIEKGGDGVFNEGDYLLFYGQAPGSWDYNQSAGTFIHSPHLYSEASYYYLTSDAGVGKSISVLPSSVSPVTHTVTMFDDYAVCEQDLVNLIQSGREWFEPMVSYQPRDIPFTFPNIDPAAPVKVTARVASRSPLSNNFLVELNGNSLFTIPLDGVNISSFTSDYASANIGSGTGFSSTDNNTITLHYNANGVPSSECWIDYVSVHARRKLIMDGNQMPFCDALSVGAGNVSKFVLTTGGNSVTVWEITDPENARKVSTVQQGNDLVFTLETDSLRRFISFTSNGYLTPALETTPLNNQDLHGMTSRNMVIVSAPAFLDEANQLAEWHASQGLQTIIVTPDQVCNEFSSGMPDVSALRNFMKMLYDRAPGLQDIPEYLLLLGDGSYDNKTQHVNNTNFILTYQSQNSLQPTQSFVTDDYFGLLDDSEGEAEGSLDIGIGRLPVASAVEAQQVVNKIIKYEEPSSQGDWRNSICFIGDDEDFNIHMLDANLLAGYVDTTFQPLTIYKIFLDAYQQVSTPNGERYPEVNEAINNLVTKGTLIVNYVGHGNERGLAHENILGKADIQSWNNQPRFPLFITATCEFSRFDDVERSLTGEFSSKVSAGEMVLLNPIGGGIALLTTTRLVYSSPNFVLNQNFYNHLFERDIDGKYYRLGDLMRISKNLSGGGINKRNFTLLGDPALRLDLPDLVIKTDSINGIHVSFFADTLKALEKVTISGHVEDASGNFIPTFEGLLYPQVFDKSRDITTLNNDGYGSIQFKVQNNILYKGKASIHGGIFRFSFIIPKDISYAVDVGKISYYAADGSDDGAGSYRKALIGGFAGSVANDQEGPHIDLYMNDRQFVSGGITNDHPVLLAILSDSSGINTVGNGIGHDITAQLDDNTKDLYVLNEYYQAETDNYQRGTIEFPLRSLSSGNHTLKLKVWDVYNNSSEGTIDFTVQESGNLVLDHVFNYPNPFTTHTSFFFEHNRPGTELQVLIQVFTVSGKLVKTIDTMVFNDGFRAGPIDWDGLDDFGNKIGRGVYLYRLRVRSNDGLKAEKFEKLVILR
jgi:hypothetical protein